MILLGLGLVGGFLGVLMLLIGAVPIASAAYGALLVGPLLGRDTRGRRPDDRPEEERDEDRSGEDWSAPPLARAERPPGQEPRTKDLRADEPSGDAQG